MPSINYVPHLMNDMTQFSRGVSVTENLICPMPLSGFLGDPRDSIPWIRAACLMRELPSLLECDTKKSLPQQWQQRRVHRAMPCTAALAVGNAGVLELS